MNEIVLWVEYTSKNTEDGKLEGTQLDVDWWLLGLGDGYMVIYYIILPICIHPQFSIK